MVNTKRHGLYDVNDCVKRRTVLWNTSVVVVAAYRPSESPEGVECI